MWDHELHALIHLRKVRLQKGVQWHNHSSSHLAMNTNTVYLTVWNITSDCHKRLKQNLEWHNRLLQIYPKSVTFSGPPLPPPPLTPPPNWHAPLTHTYTYNSWSANGIIPSRSVHSVLSHAIIQALSVLREYCSQIKVRLFWQELFYLSLCPIFTLWQFFCCYHLSTHLLRHKRIAYFICIQFSNIGWAVNESV